MMFKFIKYIVEFTCLVRASRKCIHINTLVNKPGLSSLPKAMRENEIKAYV